MEIVFCVPIVAYALLLLPTLVMMFVRERTDLTWDATVRLVYSARIIASIRIYVTVIGFLVSFLGLLVGIPFMTCVLAFYGWSLAWLFDFRDLFGREWPPVERMRYNIFVMVFEAGFLALLMVDVLIRIFHP